ncbi:MAG TPA: hypothetical protein VF974_02615 [Patescibacteria group bacterium]
MKFSGFGLIGLIIVIAIAVALIFGYRAWDGSSKKNQIESGRDAIDQAQKAADQQNQGSLYLQNQVQDSPSVNYHGLQNNLKSIKK